MDSQAEKTLHFVLFPFLAQGHLIPMIDMARLLAQHGVFVSIVTTPLNAARFESVIARAEESGLPIRVLHLQFPCAKAGLPEGYENLDMLQSLGLATNFFRAANMLEEPVEELLQVLTPAPTCIIFDNCLTFMSNIASKFQIPQICFHGYGCFPLLCLLSLRNSSILSTVTSESEYFLLPNLPDRVEFTKGQLIVGKDDEFWKELGQQMAAADSSSYAVVVNTFQELEPEYVQEYRKAMGQKVWCIGPLSLWKRSGLDKAERGKKAIVDEQQCLNWLDCQEPCSVVYACLGSLCNLLPEQLMELGLALEASNRPFIWVIREWDTLKELEKWLSEDGYEERIKDRGLLIKGWAPQVLILSHPAIAAFLTHCGWNSTIEGITAGVPLITWPLFGDQFLNEKLVVQVLKIGVSIGVQRATLWGEEQTVGVLAKKEDIRSAIDKLMDKGKEGEERRKRVQELAERAKNAVEEGGSSHLNVKMLIQDITQQTQSKQSIV